MEKLKSALSFGGILSKTEIDEVYYNFGIRKIKAGEHFLSLHRVAKEIAFVDNGVMRIYSTDSNGTDVTKYFIKENQFYADLESYYSLQPATDAIQAVVNCELYTTAFSDFEKLYEAIPNLFILFKTITEVTLLNKIKDNDFLNFGTSKTKYIEFVRRYPTLIQQVPQQYIASYLKITPQSLSRIRKELVKSSV